LIVGGILLLVLRSPIPPEDVPVPGSEGLESLAEDEKAPPANAPLTTAQMMAGLGLVLAAALAWSASTLWLRVIAVGVPALAVTAIRVPCGALFLVVTLGLRRQLSLRGIPPRALLLLCAAGVFGTGFGSMLYIVAVQRTSAGVAALLVSTSPLWVLPLAAIFLHERVTGRVLAGAALTVGGIWLVLI
jgi:drug/metabolite transporter (DMT)-like permease